MKSLKRIKKRKWIVGNKQSVLYCIYSTALLFYKLYTQTVVLFDSQKVYNKYNLYIFFSLIFNHII